MDLTLLSLTIKVFEFEFSLSLFIILVLSYYYSVFLLLLSFVVPLGCVVIASRTGCPKYGSVSQSVSLSSLVCWFSCS